RNAFEPAIASCSSWSALAAPLTPTPPTIWPSTTIGIPPTSGVKSFSAVITVRPLPLELTSSSKTRVGRLNNTDVRAFPIEILAPAAKVPSRRSNAMRLPPSSTTAITPPGACTLLASAFAAAITLSAPSSVSVFFSLVCPVNIAAVPTSNVSTETHCFFMACLLSREIGEDASPTASCALIVCLLHRRTEAGLAQVHFCEGAPDHDLGNVLHVLGDNDFLLVVVAQERFGLEFVEQIDVPVRIDYLPVRIWSVGNNEVIGQREDAFPILRAVSDRALVGFRALERARRVAVSCERRHREKCRDHQKQRES